MLVLTLESDRLSAITWFGDSSVFRQFGLPRDGSPCPATEAPTTLTRYAAAG
jgi:hypothetical protein